jgi:hypothetical protein
MCITLFQDDIIASDPPQFDECVATFSPVYQALVSIDQHVEVAVPERAELDHSWAV